MNKTFCLITGISPDKIEKGLISAEKHMQKDTAQMEVYLQFIGHSMLSSRVSEITESFWRDPQDPETALTELPEDLLRRQGRVVIIQSFIKEHVFAIMRGIKSASSRPQDIIFAMVTDTAASWTLEEYLKHLKTEHEYMKTHTPDQDPDMRKLQ
jgi:hypothetical protein